MTALLQVEETSRPVRIARLCIRRLGLRPPIDVLAVARACGLPVLPQPLDWHRQVDAFLAFHPATGRWAIFVDPRNPLHWRKRRRFSIAHELGHYLLHRNLIMKGDPLDSPHYEREANAFAAELLMPADLVEEVYFKHRRFLEPVFDVSYEAITCRLRQLGYRR